MRLKFFNSYFQEWVNELIAADELPYLFSFVPKVLLAIVVSILDEIYKEIAVWLTHQGEHIFTLLDVDFIIVSYTFLFAL